MIFTKISDPFRGDYGLLNIFRKILFFEYRIDIIDLEEFYHFLGFRFFLPLKKNLTF